MKNGIWFLKGVRKGVKTEKFPRSEPVEIARWSTEIAGSGEANCPTDAITNGKWDMTKCIFCRRCLPGYEPTGKHEIFTVGEKMHQFRKSFFIYPLDSGACGACNTELHALTAPQYDMHRLGIFFTNTPRHADAIAVMGVWTEGMEEPLKRAYDAMSDPKMIILMGACAISGGIIGEGALKSGEYNVAIAGCPPNPYTILAALIRARGD
jgi:Ni,Fe-hydrogenase III small subunit